MGALEDAEKQAEEMMKQAMAQGQAQGGAFANPNIAAAQAEVAAIRQETAELDLNDPAFAPIEGVSYDDYVALCVKMQPAGADAAKQEEIAVANGFTKEKWKTVSDGYTQRCIANPVFARRLGQDVLAGGKS